jgi:diacylglycerol kinase family enzyme
MHVGAGARPDDGLFHVVEASGVGRLRSVLQWPRLYRGLHGVRGVRVRAGRHVRVMAARGQHVLVDCDGEVCGSLPATYTVIPHAVALCVPAQ